MIPDWQLLAFVDEQDASGDGVRKGDPDAGTRRSLREPDQWASLRRFVAAVLRDELGLGEGEVPAADVEGIVGFVRLL